MFTLRSPNFQFLMMRDNWYVRLLWDFPTATFCARDFFRCCPRATIYARDIFQNKFARLSRLFMRAVFYAFKVPIFKELYPNSISILLADHIKYDCHILMSCRESRFRLKLLIPKRIRFLSWIRDIILRENRHLFHWLHILINWL